jgi:DNA-binding transcriptional LysR family regulator
MTTLSFYQLTIFESLLRLKSVTEAAETLDLPQATFSRHLAQLRDYFGDPLFVRTRGGMEPTAVALSLQGAVADALALFRNRLSGHSYFDPQTSERDFQIAASDIGHFLVLPRLQASMRERAPHMRFTAVPLGKTKLIAQLEAGEVDLAIGSFPNLFTGVREQTLFREEYVCVRARTKGNRNTSLSLEEFKASKHILVAAHLLGHVHQEVEKKILALCKPANVRILSESFLLSALIAERTDLLLTVPSRAASMLDRKGLQILEPPIKLPGFDVKQYWHERFDQDSGNKFIRQAIADIWQRSSPPVVKKNSDSK